jgi:hypothetical protein
MILDYTMINNHTQLLKMDNDKNDLDDLSDTDSNDSVDSHKNNKKIKKISTDYDKERQQEELDTEIEMFDENDY